jgi:hypothetical protein
LNGDASSANFRCAFDAETKAVNSRVDATFMKQGPPAVDPMDGSFLALNDGRSTLIVIKR